MSKHIATLVLLAAAFTGMQHAAADDAEATAYRFGVFYGDRRIGEHVYEVVRDANATQVRSRADFQVKVLFVTAYRYEHRADELWRDGCLTELSSVTNDNGKRFQIQAVGREAGPQFASLQSAPEPIVLDAECPASFAYWDRERLTANALVNAQNGVLSPATLIEEGPEVLDGTETVRFRLEADGIAPITLWYRRSDDVWLRLETRREDKALQYRLEGLERGAQSAIEQNARVQDPARI